MVEAVDLLIEGPTILTMSELGVIREGAIAIKGDRIVEVGRRDRILDSYRGEQVIDGRGYIAMPGLIDCHTHTFQVLLRGSLSLKEFSKHPVWLNVLIPFEGALTEKEARISAQLSCLNMIKMGTTCFADAGGPRPETLAKAVVESGLRAVITRSTMDRGQLPETMKDSTDEALVKNMSLIERWNGSGDGRIKVWFGIRQIMTSTDELLHRTAELARKYNVGIHIHLSEEILEVDHALRRWGERPVEHLANIGLLSDKVLAAHCSYLTDHEVKILAEHRVSVAHCPVINYSYMYNPKIPQMLTSGVNVCMGTDGGSMRPLDMFQEAITALVCCNAHYGTPYYDHQALTLQDVLEMATTNGAKALMWNHEIGAIKPGYKADIILIDTRRPHLTPLYDPYSIPLLCQGTDVTTVIVNGKTLMQNGRVKTLNEEQIIEEARELAPTLIEKIENIAKK